MPGIFNSLRLLFGLAFGYIMLAEIVRGASDAGGLGSIISNAQKAAATERYPPDPDAHSIGGLGHRPAAVLGSTSIVPLPVRRHGLLHQGVRSLCRAWEDMKAIFCKPVEAARHRVRPRPPGRPREEDHREAPNKPPPRTLGVCRDPAAIGMGQVVDRFAKPKEHGFPRVVEFRSVTKTYNAGLPNQYTAVSNVSFIVEDTRTRESSSASSGPAGAARARSCG